MRNAQCTVSLVLLLASFTLGREATDAHKSSLPRQNDQELQIDHSAPQSTPARSDLIANVSSRTAIDLGGTWRAIIDPYDVGFGGRFYENRKPKNKQELLEYDFDSLRN